MRKILFTLYKNKTHSLYRQFISNPPEWYKYYFLDDFFNYNVFDSWKTFIQNLLLKIKRNNLILDIAKKNNIDLIYSVDWQLLFSRQIPWIVDLEHLSPMIWHDVNHFKIYKKIIPFILSQKSLKKIIPWTKAGEKSLKLNLKLNKKVLNKIKVIHLCKNNYKKNIEYKENTDIIKILFITSVNYNFEWEFFSKWWPVVIKIFEELEKIWKKVELRIRWKLPKEFNFIRKNKNIFIYEDILNWNKFENLFLESNIFLYPWYQSPWMVFLDVLEYWIPIITNKIFSNNEHVLNWKNWYLINISKYCSAYHWNNNYWIKWIPNWTYSKEEYNKIINDKDYIWNYIQSILNIFEKWRLNFFSKESRTIFEKEFIFEKRNNELKLIYNYVLESKTK